MLIVNEYPIMHYFGNPRQTQSAIAHKIFISKNSSEKSNYGNVFNIPYWQFPILTSCWVASSFFFTLKWIELSFSTASISHNDLLGQFQKVCSSNFFMSSFLSWFDLKFVPVCMNKIVMRWLFPTYLTRKLETKTDPI